MDIATRFWSKVNKKGPVHPVLRTRCWLWTGAKFNSGYGEFRIIWNKPLQRAHRVAWFLIHGEWPKPQALHICDNPPCCNPEHLFEGTPKDNMSDKSKKGRGNVPTGIRHGQAKLTRREVNHIKIEYRRPTVTQDELAKKYNVSQRHISRIVRGECRANG